MLLPDVIDPVNSLYYNGAIVIEVLKDGGGSSLMDLYLGIRERYGMSISVLVLSVDWLFLIDVVEIDEAGRIELCS